MSAPDIQIAALYVESGGVYSGVPHVDPWDISRDARLYLGPFPVVAHPPCERWGRYWHGSPRKPHQFKLGDDQGCFEAALKSVQSFGGVLEHPADSHAFKTYGLPIPKRHQGWTEPDSFGGRSCYVEQCHYGHKSRKATWLYACKTDFPEMNWSRGHQRIPDYAIEKYGYEKARRIGVMAVIGGKHKKAIRNRTPVEFRDLLISIARTCVHAS